MLHKRIEDTANAIQAKIERVNILRLTDTFSSQAQYLLFRMKYPLLQKITSKLLILLEAYLLFRYFYLSLALTVLLVFFLLTFIRQALTPIFQRFRKLYVESSEESHVQRQQKLYSACMYVTATVSLPLAALVGGGVAMGTDSNFLIVLVLCHAIVFQCVMLSAVSWAAVYTQHRLYRAFTPVLATLLLPSISIVLFANVLQEYSYVFGILIGGLLENIYLITLARKALAHSGIHLVPFKYCKAEIREILSFKALLPSFVMLLALPLYSIFVALTIYSERPELWVGYFLVTHLAMTVGFPVIRISQAYGVDLFIAIKLRDQVAKRRIFSNLLFFLFVSLSFLTSTVILLSTFFSESLQLYFDSHFPYWILFIAILIARSLYNTGANVITWLGSEKSYALVTFSGMYLLLFPLQYLSLLEFRVTLPSVLILETLTFTLLGLYFLATKPQEKSVFSEGKSRININERMHICCIQLEKKYGFPDEISQFTSELQEYIHKDIEAIALSPKVLLLCSKDHVDQREFFKKLPLYFASRLKGVYEIKSNSLTISDIKEIATQFIKYRHADEWIKTVFAATQNKVYEKLENWFRKKENLSSDEIIEYLAINKLLPNNYSKRNGDRFFSSGSLSIDLLRKTRLQRLSRYSQGNYLLSKGDEFLTVKRKYQPLLVMEKTKGQDNSILIETLTLTEIFCNITQKKEVA